MLASPDIHRLIAGLRDATNGEQVALTTLTQVLGQAQQSTVGKVLRGVIHVRPDDGYTTLSALEAGGTRLHDLDPGGAELLSSSSLWRALHLHQVPLVVELTPGVVRRASDGQVLAQADQSLSEAKSRQRFIGRGATHVLALPLIDARHDLCGMLNVELSVSEATTPDWRSASEPAYTAVTVAVPYLLAARMPSPPPDADEFLPVVGSTMAGLLPILRTFAGQDETILVTGPTGAGKTRLARWCHQMSAHRNAPFEILDLTTVPEDLQMAELFGWVRGAFTGAVRDSSGAIGRASGGTLFIDEIDKLSMKAQAGLLQLMERRRYRVLGDGGAERVADVRFVIGTNINLAAAVRGATFREDLYFRINVLPIRIPGLDERRDEIAPWARYMVERHHTDRDGEGSAKIDEAALKLLEGVSWPGNLRQLDNIVRRAYTLALVGIARGQLVAISAENIKSALAYDLPAGTSPSDVLWQAAVSLVQALSRSPQVDGELGDIFRPFLVAAAVREFGVESALTFLGKGSLVANRNHHRMLRRERERLDDLAKVFGWPTSPAAEYLATQTEPIVGE